MKVYTNDCHLGQMPKAKIFANVWTKVLDEYMREFNYMANCANLSLSVAPLDDNVNFQWSGFNDTMSTYVLDSISQLVQMRQVNLEEIFDQVKEKLLKDWANFYLGQSYQQAFTFFDNNTLNTSVEMKVLSQLLESYTFSEFEAQHKDWLANGRQTWLVSGNLMPEEA